MPNPTVPIFNVTECPPWYLTSDYKDVFSCKTSKGLFEAVAKLMVSNQSMLSEQAKRYSPKNIYKTIRDMVINQSEKLQQNPSPSLLLALMDLVEMEGGNDFVSMPNVDRAGLKDVLLAYGNYMTFYVPNKAW